MVKETYFQVPEEKRAKVIQNSFPNANEKTLEEVTALVDNWEGLDMHALSILIYADERDRFDEFYTKLQEEYDNRLISVSAKDRLKSNLYSIDLIQAATFQSDSSELYMHPDILEVRKNRASKTQQVIMNAYQDLEISPA